MHGREGNNNAVSPIDLAAKHLILHFISYIVPPDESNCSQESPLYRLALEHGDYGIHNMLVAVETGSSRPFITSLYNWETACIVPAILSDLLVAVTVGLVTIDAALPPVIRVSEDQGPLERKLYMT